MYRSTRIASTAVTFMLLPFIAGAGSGHADPLRQGSARGAPPTSVARRHARCTVPRRTRGRLPTPGVRWAVTSDDHQAHAGVDGERPRFGRGHCCANTRQPTLVRHVRERDELGRPMALRRVGEKLGNGTLAADRPVLD